MTESITQFFISQGLQGVVSLLALLAVVYLYRENGQQRERYEGVIQKLNEDRISELRAGMSVMNDAMQTVKTANSNFEAALDVLSKRQ